MSQNEYYILLPVVKILGLEYLRFGGHNLYGAAEIHP